MISQFLFGILGAITESNTKSTSKGHRTFYGFLQKIIVFSTYVMFILAFMPP